MIDKIFPRKLNRSKDARIQDKTEMYDALNISVDDFDSSSSSISSTGDAGVIKPVKGNKAISQSLSEETGNKRVLGSVADHVNDELFLFVFSDIAEEQGVYRVVNENFEPVYVSNHFQFLHDDFVKGDIVYQADGDRILYFTDGRNEPRKLPLFREFPEDASAARKIDFITACPKTPMHPPTWEFSSDPSRPVNFRSVEGFQFAYQCIYDTGEESAISTYSDVAIPPVYFTQGALVDVDLDANNLIKVFVPQVVNQIENYTGNIKKIRLLVRIGNNGAFFTVSEKEAEENLVFDFYNDSVLTGVPQEDQDKLNDALPRVARSQTIVNDRLIYGNYQEGYNTGTVKASFRTINNSRPEDFVDLRIGIIPLIAPAFKESSAATVGFQGDTFVPSIASDANKVFNRRASYQFDLSSLPPELPEGAIAELSFSVEPDKDFELYNSENSFHTFRNSGFGLGLDQDLGSIFPACRRVGPNGYGAGSPTVFQNNIGVQQNGISWISTDPGVEGSIDNIKFGTSPSNPFIIPKEFINFKVRFKLEQTFSGDGAVEGLISSVLKTYFNDESLTGVDGVTFFVDGSIADAIEGQNPVVSVNQLMDSSDGYGLISDEDSRARTVVSCYKEDEYTPSDAIAPVGFFAVNKADVKFALRFSQKVNDSLSGEFDRGPVFSLHIKDIQNVETVTMVPRITRSGARGWIYFTKDYIQNPLNQENVRKICLFDQPEIPVLNTTPVQGVLNDMNVFFLNNNFCPITNSDGVVDFADELESTGDYVENHKILPGFFLNSGPLEITTEATSGLLSVTSTWRNFQNTEAQYVPGSANDGLFSPGGTELDDDFRIQAGISQYPEYALSFGSHEVLGGTLGAIGDNSTKRRIIGYLELNDQSRPIRIADPNSEETDFVYSIVDGETNIRNKNGRVNPSFWYGIYYGTQYAGKNNNQFLLSEGSTSSSPVGLLHGGFFYKSFEGSEAQTKIDALIPDIEVGPRSFILTANSTSPGGVGRSFKRNCDHSFALLYYDERGRPGEPVPLGSHFVRQVSDPGVANIELNIDPDVTPPDWAHTYKVLYGGNNSISDFVQYTAGGAFVPKNSDNEKGLIYVSLNYLQENYEVSYSKAFGAVRYDGDKDLYTFSEGDRLRIISYYDDEDNVQYPQVNNPYEFQVVGTVTLNNDATENPLAVEGDEVHPAKTGQFVILKDNLDANGFSFSDVSGSLSGGNTTQNIYDPNNYWTRRCVFEIFSPQKKREVESRIYYEIGESYNVVREEGSEGNPLHQTTSILINQGDVYFRKMAVNMPDFDPTTNSFLGLIGDGTDTAAEATSPNFRSYHLESKTFTDLFPNADVLPYGKPRIALQKVQPVRDGNNVECSGSSNAHVRKSSIKFSDRSNSNSNIVRYTSFNDSKLPFKDLQTNDGEIFYLVNYNDSIFCIQRLKCSSIPVSRNILADALGNETVIATEKVLGTEKYYAGSYGTDVPESVALADNTVYFVSVRQKEVYRFNPNSGIEVISEKGMSSFFDEMISAAENSGAFKMVGGFDVDQQEYILSSTTNLVEITAPALPEFSNVVTADAGDDVPPGPVVEEEVSEDVAAIQEELNQANEEIIRLQDEILQISQVINPDLKADEINYNDLDSLVEDLEEQYELDTLTFTGIVDAFQSGRLTQEQAKEIFDGLRKNNIEIAADFDLNGAIGTGDLLDFLSVFNQDVSNLDLNPFFPPFNGTDYGTGDPIE